MLNRQKNMALTNIKKNFWQTCKESKQTIILATIVSYVTASCAHVFGVYFKEYLLYRYNKFFVILLICVLLLRISKNRIIRLKLPGLIWFGIFFAYALLHGLYPAGDRAFDIAYSLLKIYTLFLIIINLFRTKKEYIILGITFAVVTTITLAVYYVHARRHGWGSRITAEKLGFFINANTISYIAVLAFIIYMFVTKNGRFKGCLFSQLCVLAGAAIIINANASIGAFVLLTATVMLTMLKLKNTKILLLSVCIILIIGYVYYKYIPYTKLITQRIEYKIKAGQYDERPYLTRIAFDTFWDEPVWGKGYDSLSVCEGKPFNHLWYLNVLVAYGIFGLLFVFMWFIAIVPVRAFFISRYSVALLFYIFIFLLLAPPPMLFSMVLAFLYWETRQKSCAELKIQNDTILSLHGLRHGSCLKH